MSTELPKTYDPSLVEAQAYKVWIDEGCFTADPSRPGQSYCIVIPPPNVTGALHLGHAINDTLQDVLIRYHRMRGFNALWVPGIDHAGIATQAVVEKQLRKEENKSRHDIGREALVQRIWAWKEQYGNRILEQLKRMGCSCDWTRARFTLDEQCARAVRETFFKLFKDGLIYRGKRLVNWDIHLQTSISDDEIYHETVKTNLWHIRYPIAGTDQFVTVATTRPETMLGDTAVAVHSQDSRWAWAIGKMVDLPLTGRQIPIIADDILVDPKFGTGVVKVTPAHDPNDYAVWSRHQKQEDAIGILNILNPDGTINAAGGNYAGMKREAARVKVVEDLAAARSLEKTEAYETQVGHSDRSGLPIEPYLSDQWFVKMAPLAEPALQVVRDEKVRFSPARYAQTYLAWLGEKRDWPISRQLWWGHRIPVWTKELPHNSPTDHVKKIATTLARFRQRADVAVHNTLPSPDGTEPLRWHVCLQADDAGVIADLESAGFARDPDVLDTWFSSALWPHSTLGWPEQTADLKRYYPTSVLVTSRDIITLWVARMVMTGIYNMKAIPFRDVAIHPTILDGKGERMSKTKGNGVDPVDVIETHGADALRFTLTSMATETQDVRMPVKTDATGRNTSDKFDLGRNFCNKLWNAARFAFANLEAVAPLPSNAAIDDPHTWSLPERWILSRLARAIAEIDDAVAVYRFDAIARAAYDFFWRDLCDWFIEAVKPGLKDPGPRGQRLAAVLAYCMDASLRLLHPIIPFITETLWWRLNEIRPQRSLPGFPEPAIEKRLVHSRWPAGLFKLVDDGAEQEFSRFQEIVTAIRNVRNEHKVDVKSAVAVTVVPPADRASEMQSARELVEQFTNCNLTVGNPADAAPPGIRVPAASCDVFVVVAADDKTEHQRNARRIEELTRQASALRARLANPGYADKAPAKLVQQTRDQLAEAEAELAKLTGG